ncbi:SDR family NAD(P)-dependent oxidoreductase [Candidatus Haliotispira prima]|uniref:SDR family NAD(P)-dependent oxidoreductase n=1 Tax=Candidatus Haliotispira prima TaxID=3034016 RepID=A0ABY8MJ58_9SPIO|nr:SDR family NAD(P)-dependent oxidoreductase [Candidatus Haliotispira prima]
MKKKWERAFYFGRKIVVYGATGGLGEALCREIYGNVTKLVLAGRNIEKLRTLKQSLEENPVDDRTQNTELELWVVDTSMDKFAHRVRQGQFDGFIVATGITSYREFCVEDQRAVSPDIVPEVRYKTWQDYEELLQVNLADVVRLALELLPHFRQRQGFFHIAGSYSCIFPVPYQALYSASKAALLTFVQAVNREQEAEFGVDKVRGLLSISLIGGMATNMYYGSDLHKQFATFEGLFIAAPQKIAISLLRGIARRQQIITVKAAGFLTYHFVRRLPAKWISYGLLRAYQPKH